VTNPLTELDLATLRRRRSVKWRQYPDDVLPLFVAEMDTPLAPPIQAALATAIRLGDTGYADPQRLPEAFAGFVARRFGWWPDPASMVIAADVASSMMNLLRVLTRRGDAVLFNTPGYPPFFPDIRNTGRQVRESPLSRSADGRYSLDLDRLAHDLAAPDVTAYVLVNPHNPTGLVLSRADLSAVAQLADQHGVRVIADEIHGPLCYPGVSFVPYLSLPEAQRGVSLMAASKAWNIAGLKAALIVPGTAAVDDVRAIPIEARFATGVLGVLASEVAFRSAEGWLDALLDGLTANRALLGTLVAEHLPQVGYQPPDATFLAWLDCRGLGLPPGREAEVFLDEGRVAVNAGPTFGQPGTGFVRLNFATSPQLLTAAVQQMAAAVSSRVSP
jgi:cystathionine beta-lyase